MGKSYSYKNSATNASGLKTTVTITTEDPQVIRDLLESGNAKASGTSKKDESIKAKVKEVKPKAKAKPKTSKALPAPKVSAAKKSNTSKAEPKAKPKTNSSNSKVISVSEFRSKLRALKPNGTQELRIGSNVICRTHNGYGVRYYKHEPDPMTDYNPWTFGFKEKWLIDEYLKQGLLKK